VISTTGHCQPNDRKESEYQAQAKEKFVERAHTSWLFHRRHPKESNVPPLGARRVGSEPGRSQTPATALSTVRQGREPLITARGRSCHCARATTLSAVDSQALADYVNPDD